MSEPEVLWPPLPHPLPITVRPLRHEALASYIDRLISANHAGRNATWDALGRDGHENFLARLSSMTHRDPDALVRAIPEFYHSDELERARRPRIPVPLPDETINTLRHPCRRCAVARRADPQAAEIWMTHETHLCPRHQLWIGPGTESAEHQPDLRRCPEISRAQMRHRQVIRRRGRPIAYRAYVLAHAAWDALHTRHGYTRDRDLRLILLDPRDPTERAFLEAADYPEIVALTAVLASPYWLSLLRTPGKARYLTLARHIHDSVTDEYQPPGPEGFLLDLRRAVINADPARDDTARNHGARPRRGPRAR